MRAYVFRFAQTRTLLDAFLAETTSNVMRSGRDQVVRCCGFFGLQFVAEHAGFFPRRLGREAPQQEQQRLGDLAVGGAMRQHARCITMHSGRQAHRRTS